MTHSLTKIVDKSNSYEFYVDATGATVLALDGVPVTYVSPTNITPSSSSNLSVQTDAAPTGGAFTAFAAQACNALVLDNTSRGDIEYQRNGSGAFITVPAGTQRTIIGITDASQIGVRRSDYAVVGNTRRTTLVAKLIIGSTALTSVSTTSVNLTSGGGWATFASAACVAMELINTSGKAVVYRLNGAGVGFRVRHNDSTIIYGITNANQVGLQAGDAVIGFIRDPQAELFNSVPTERLSNWRSAAIVSDETYSEFDGWQYPNLFPAGLISTPALVNRTRLKKNGKRPLAQFVNVAGTVSTQPATLADSTQGQFMFGQSAVEYTQVNNTICQFAPATVLAAGQDVTGGHIHITFAFPAGTVDYNSASTFTTFRVRLYSAGTPASPGANYHEATLQTNFRLIYLSRVISGGSGNGIRIYSMAVPLSSFAVVGTGATLTSIIYAAFYLQGATAGNGAKFRPFEIAYVPSYTKAAVIFCCDDLHIGQYTNLAPVLARYGYPAVIFADTLIKFPATAGSFMTIEDALSLQNNFGWQLTHQVLDVETGVNLSPKEWMLTASKAVKFLQALGASDPQDGSYGSATTTNINDERINAATRVYRSLTTFINGADATPPLQWGECLPFGDPYLLQRLNMSSAFTAGQIYNRWKDHVDQAVTNKGVAIFGCHADFNNGSNAENFTAIVSLCDYIRTLEVAGTCEVHTIGSLIKAVYG